MTHYLINVEFQGDLQGATAVLFVPGEFWWEPSPAQYPREESASAEDDSRAAMNSSEVVGVENMG